MSEQDPRSDLVMELAEQFIDRLRRGEHPSLKEYIDAHPNLAGEIRDVFPAMAIMEQLAAPGDAQHSATSVPPEESLPEQIGNFRILQEVGRGGMGVVYKAHDAALKRDVAIKVLRGAASVGVEQMARFRLEAEAMARLRHPHVVQIHAFGEHQGMPFLVLEYIEGGSLAERIRGKPQPPRDAARLVGLLARAVHAAHQAGIVHRDLKPANILLNWPADAAALNCVYGWPKVSDFGLARCAGDNSWHTASGVVLGSPSYMAPEQAGGHPGAVGPATDVYALGAILYECLTGQPPFRGASVLEVVARVCSALPTTPRALRADVPAELEAICLKALHKEPRLRPRSAAAMADDLERFLKRTSSAASATGDDIRADNATELLSGRRGFPWKRLLAGLGVLIVLGGLLAWRPWTRPLQRDEVSQFAGDQEEKPKTDGAPVVQPPAALPAAQSERQAAEWALETPAGLLLIQTGTKNPGYVNRLGSLPKGDFHILHLEVSGQEVRDADLARLANLERLGMLTLRSTAVKGPGFIHLAGPPRFTSLRLIGTPLTVEGARQLLSAPFLRELTLVDAQTSPEAVKLLRQVPLLLQLRIKSADLTDDWLPALEGLRGLKTLDLKGTKVSKEGVARLRKAMPNCQVEQ